MANIFRTQATSELCRAVGMLQASCRRLAVDKCARCARPLCSAHLHRAESRCAPCEREFRRSAPARSHARTTWRRRLGVILVVAGLSLVAVCLAVEGALPFAVLAYPVLGAGLGLGIPNRAERAALRTADRASAREAFLVEGSTRSLGA